MLVSLDLFRFAEILRVIQLNRNLNINCFLKGYITLFQRWEQSREPQKIDPPKYFGLKFIRRIRELIN